MLILPSDSEPFRQVIYNNYILKRGGGNMNYWHGLIIKHFQTEPNSLRKCEELPWHLKICRKWHALRDALVDLDSFDLMSKTDLKSELIEYWALLTEGPLPLPLPEITHDGHAESGALFLFSFLFLFYSCCFIRAVLLFTSKLGKITITFFQFLSSYRPSSIWQGV